MTGHRRIDVPALGDFVIAGLVGGQGQLGSALISHLAWIRFTWVRTVKGEMKKAFGDLLVGQAESQQPENPEFSWVSVWIWARTSSLW